MNELNRQAGRSLGDALLLDVEAAALELAQEGTQELVPAARGRRRELVEEREIRALTAKAQPLDLGLRPPTERVGAAHAAAHRARHDRGAVRRFHTWNPGYASLTFS